MIHLQLIKLIVATYRLLECGTRFFVLWQNIERPLDIYVIYLFCCFSLTLSESYIKGTICSFMGDILREENERQGEVKTSVMKE